MNERIKELATQAGANWIASNRQGVDHNYITTESQMEKFAELIIKECIAVHVDDYGVDIISNALKKHFGVEE